MTHTPDWADEIAARVYLPDLMDASQVLALRHGSPEAMEAANRNKIESTKQQRHAIAAALREVRHEARREGHIAGLREAAEIAAKIEATPSLAAALRIRAVADKLEGK